MIILLNFWKFFFSELNVYYIIEVLIINMKSKDLLNIWRNFVKYCWFKERIKI